MTLSRTARPLVKVLGLALACGLAVTFVPQGATASTSDPDPFAGYPSSMTISGVFRDFRAHNVRGGHPDFEMNPPQGYALFSGMVQDTIGADTLPAFASTGFKVTTQAVDSQGRPIIGPKSYIQARTGDTSQNRALQVGGDVTSAASFNEWFRDTNGVNESRIVSVVMDRIPDTNHYYFDGDLTQGGPPGSGGYTVNNNHDGNAHGGNQNFDFTYQCTLGFTYQTNQGQFFTFAGDDDMWVFIDGKLVIDLGGMHTATWQNIDLDRLTWLQSGHDYQISIFYAERHKTQSKFHIETCLQLRSVGLPPTSALAD